MRILKVLLCMILCLALVGCENEQPQTPDVSEYLGRFAAMDYVGMYAQTSPAVDIDEAGFIKKYDDIFSGLGVSEVVIETASPVDEDGAFSFTATYKTEEFGDFSNVFTAKTTFVDDEWKVLWDYSLIFPEMETGYSVRVKTLHADRGEIFAADGTLMARNTFADTLYMDTTKVQDITAAADATIPLTGMTKSKMVELFNDAMEQGEQIVVLGEFYADELTEVDKQAVLNVPGLGIDDEMYTPIRDYPMKEQAAHLLGYTGFYTEENLPEGYTVSDRAGLSGLEAAYEIEMRGSDGRIVYIEDKWGNTVRTLYHVPCAQGQDLRLTIKPSLQKRAYDALSTMLEGDETGAVIVMDASNGFVEAMVSYPSFDNNLFTFGLSDEEWNYFKADENNRPLFARTTQGLYPPGSAIKPFTASAVLAGGAVTPDSEFDGVIDDNQWTPEEDWHWPSIKRVDDSGSPLKLHNALVYSDNIYFAWASLQLGADAFMQYMRGIGMENAVTFDLPVKEAGLIKEEMTRRLLADMGYGQGQLLVTPLQMAAMYTAFANGTGDMLQPILVEKLCQTDGPQYNTVEKNDKMVWIEDAVSAQNIDILSPILHDVIEDGTGKRARIRGVKIAGKTGTAEITDNKSREISWFAGYWEDGYYPRLVVVMVDTAAEEGVVKFDIAHEMLMP